MPDSPLEQRNRGGVMARSAKAAAVILLLLLAAVANASHARCEPVDWMAELLDEVTSSEIISTVLDLQSFSTRDFHTSSATESAYYIHGVLQGLGMQTHLQEFEVDGVTAVNVVAVLHPESAAEGVYVVGAHYDSENSMVTNQSEAENITAPGADDNASGVGVMLEIARVLAGSDCELPTVKFVAFGAEERGYDRTGGIKGSAEFAASEAEAGVLCRGAFILDMVGYRAMAENRATLVSNGASDHLADSMADAASEFGLDITIWIESNESIRYSDHSAFWTEGYPSILVIEELNQSTHFPVNPYYHTSYDTADKLSEEQMTLVAKALLGTLLHLTDQGEYSYTPAFYGIVAAAMISVIITVMLLLLRKWKGES